MSYPYTAPRFATAKTRGLIVAALMGLLFLATPAHGAPEAVTTTADAAKSTETMVDIPDTADAATQSSPEAGTDLATEVLPQLDKNGVPYRQTALAAPGVPSRLVAEMAAAGELRDAYIDDTSRLMVLVTKGGVVLSVAYDRTPEQLQALFNGGIIPKFVTFAEAPVSELQRIEKQKDSFNWGVMAKILPFLVLISGIAIISQLRDRKKRKEQGVTDGTTAFQTREGPAGFIPTVTFEDVAGCEEAIEDLSEIVEFLKNPERFERLGAKVPRGAILVGPPGTGKTLLARAVAGEAKVAFFTASGSDFVEMYVGVGPMRVRELFTKARAAEKAIIFIDEIDAVARARVMSTKQNANDERENTLNALLNEMDGFSRGNVILLAATNRVDILDPAILRPGRLDRKIQVPNPDRRGREKILAVHTEGKPLAKDVDLGQVARRTPGMSGADLAQISNEAAIEAARRGLKALDASCFSSAVALVAMGRARRSALVTDRDRLITAYHEAGHTICALMHPDAPNPVSVSITPRGHAGGITWMNGSDDQYLARPQAAAQLIVAMGGRIGEELLLNGEFTQGPSSDLEKATQLATVMVTRYGMTRRGLAVRPGEPDRDSHAVIEELLTVALDDARALIAANQPLFTAVVNQLLELETLELSDLQEIEAALSGDEHPEGHVGARTLQVLQQAGLLASDAVSTVGTVVAKVGRTALLHPVKARKAKPKAAKPEVDVATSTGSQTKAGSSAKAKANAKKAPAKPAAGPAKRTTKKAQNSEVTAPKKPASRRNKPKAPATE